MSRAKSNIRTKTYYCGLTDDKKTKYLEIDLFPALEIEKRYTRRGKEKVTAPKQKSLNDRYAQRYFGLLIKANFGEGDYHVTLTYNNAHLPETLEQAELEVKNCIRRLARYRKKHNLTALKYIVVTERSKTGRVHHHLIINGDGISRDVVENLWRRPRRKGQKVGDALGYANADRLQVTENGLEALAAYLSKDPKGRKRWIPSHNLRKPEVSVSDTKTSKKKFQQLTLLPVDCEEVKKYFEKTYPGYELTACRKVFNEFSASWAIYAKMRRRI